MCDQYGRLHYYHAECGNGVGVRRAGTMHANGSETGEVSGVAADAAPAKRPDPVPLMTRSYLLP